MPTCIKAIEMSVFALTAKQGREGVLQQRFDTYELVSALQTSPGIALGDLC